MSESSRRCRSLCKRAMPRPREDVVDPTAVLPLPAVPSAVPGDEVLEEDEVCLPDFVILAWRERAEGEGVEEGGRRELGKGKGGRGCRSVDQRKSNDDRRENETEIVGKARGVLGKLFLI